jgi:hypothetical protein
MGNGRNVGGGRREWAGAPSRGTLAASGLGLCRGSVNRGDCEVATRPVSVWSDTKAAVAGGGEPTVTAGGWR